MKVAFTFSTLFALVLSQTLQDPSDPLYPHDQHGPPHQQGPLIPDGPPHQQGSPIPDGPPPYPPHCPPPPPPQEPSPPGYGPKKDLSPCQQALRREREIWMYGDFYSKDYPGLMDIYAGYEQQMEDSLISDQELKARMDSYSDYVQLRSDLRYNVPKEKFIDCGDLCKGERIDVLAVYQEGVTSKGDGDDICFVIKPEIQNVFYMNCTDELSRYVQLPEGPDFTTTYACVPDGFIRRRIILWCPNADFGQCREAEVELPMACSPKMAVCVNPSKPKSRHRNPILSRRRTGR